MELDPIILVYWKLFTIEDDMEPYLRVFVVWTAYELVNNFILNKGELDINNFLAQMSFLGSCWWDKRESTRSRHRPGESQWGVAWSSEILFKSSKKVNHFSCSPQESVGLRSSKRIFLLEFRGKGGMQVFFPLAIFQAFYCLIRVFCHTLPSFYFMGLFMLSFRVELTRLSISAWWMGIVVFVVSNHHVMVRRIEHVKTHWIWNYPENTATTHLQHYIPSPPFCHHETNLGVVVTLSFYSCFFKSFRCTKKLPESK